MDEILNGPMGWLLPAGLLVIWLGFCLYCFFSPDFFDGGLGWKLIQRWKKRKEEKKMNKGINESTLVKLEAFCDDLYEGQYDGNCLDAKLMHYRHMLDVQEDMRQEPEPIDGRFIQANDRRAVIHALDFLHASIMGRCAELDEYEVYAELHALLEYLQLKFLA